jgi:hypothetical protein
LTTIAAPRSSYFAKFSRWHRWVPGIRTGTARGGAGHLCEWALGRDWPGVLGVYLPGYGLLYPPCQMTELLEDLLPVYKGNHRRWGDIAEDYEISTLEPAIAVGYPIA